MLNNNEINILKKTPQILKYEDLNDTDNTGFKACIGQDKNKNNIFIDLEKTSHVLVGGSSGSGKSCLMNCFIKSLLNKYNDFYITIIDIKRIEFLQFANSPQLVGIMENAAEAVEILQKYIDIMYNRFNILKENNCKSIKEYNAKNPNDKMQRHVILIDELADVLLDNKIIKIYLQKLLQLGRAVGLHIVCATQAPNAKTIPTELKINITCRIALQVPNYTNSKIIIDEKGAELLKGNGDALIKTSNITTNFQVAYVE